MSFLLAGSGVLSSRCACFFHTSISSSCHFSPCMRPNWLFFFEMSNENPISLPYSLSFCKFCRISYKIRSCCAASSATICASDAYETAGLSLCSFFFFPFIFACPLDGRPVTPGSSRVSSGACPTCRGSVSMSKPWRSIECSGTTDTSWVRRREANMASSVKKWGSPRFSCLCRLNAGAAPMPIVWSGPSVCIRPSDGRALAIVDILRGYRRQLVQSHQRPGLVRHSGL
mmetsp:Transcript_86802/g.140739  ORF Transcript_86802/g.140739 Transcript_86802/m.140739 type:complete len:229 (+) Transcript_86802:2022-2708(+)